MHPQQLGRFFDGATVLLGVAQKWRAALAQVLKRFMAFQMPGRWQSAFAGAHF